MERDYRSTIAAPCWAHAAARSTRDLGEDDFGLGGEAWLGPDGLPGDADHDALEGSQGLHEAVDPEYRRAGGRRRSRLWRPGFGRFGGVPGHASDGACHLTFASGQLDDTPSVIASRCGEAFHQPTVPTPTSGVAVLQ